MPVSALVKKLKAAQTRRRAIKLRSTMRAMEVAAAANDLAMLHKHTREQVRLLQTLRRDSAWPDEKLMAFLTEGDVVKSLHDPELEQIVGLKVAEAERLLGQAA
jgi:hypothetical protein